MPDDLFGPLGQGPVPPMAQAADIRARGDQRQRRSRAVLAGAGALVLVLGTGIAVSVTGGGARNEVLPGTPMTSSSPQAPRGLEAALLTPRDVEAVRDGSWSVRQTEDLPLPVLPGGCQDGVALGRAGADPQVDTVGTFLNGSDSDVVGHTLAEYTDEAAARQALGTLIDAVEACKGLEPGWTAVGGLPGTSEDRLYGELVTTDERLPYAVERVGAVLSAVQVRGATLQDMPALADAAVARLASGRPETPSASATPVPPTVDLTAAFLSPEAAGAAELPGWSVNEEYEPQAGPLLDPCGDGSAPLGGQVTASGERSMGSVREAGGSSLTQEVYAYADEPAAEAALAQYADRVLACPVAPVPEVPDTVTSDLVVTESDRLQVRNRYCNPACTDIFTTYFLVVRAGSLLTVAEYMVGEDGDPADDARSLLGATAEALAGSTRSAAPRVVSADQDVFFRSPTGRISCQLSGTAASCDINEFTYEPPPRPSTCDLDWGGMITVTAEGAAFPCYGDTAFTEDAEVLDYGQAITNQVFTCTSRTTGITCETSDGSAGFEMARDRYRLL